jgi:hypothetical protein
MIDTKFQIGDTVVVECCGRIVEQRLNARGLLYIVQPLDRALPRIHAPVEIVFSPDVAIAETTEGEAA